MMSLRNDCEVDYTTTIFDSLRGGAHHTAHAHKNLSDNLLARFPVFLHTLEGKKDSEKICSMVNSFLLRKQLELRNQTN